MLYNRKKPLTVCFSSMDVGCWLLRRSSANLLKNCINPFWGLIYSNGTCLNWLPIFAVRDALQPKPLEHENLGLIHDVSCSPCYRDSQFIAIISAHEAGLRITIWKAEGDELNLSFAETNHAFIQGEPLPQGLGIAWHPFDNILCTLCENGAFVFNNDRSDGILEKIKSFSGRERFSTCCWSFTGCFLILATQSKLLFYRSLPDSTDPYQLAFSFVIGRVCSLETVEENKLLCAVELPLSDVIRNRGDLLSKESPSPLEHLMNVSTSMTTFVASSQLLLLGYSADHSRPYIISRIDIKEILTPNIMVYEKTYGLCVIGSNSSLKLQFFAVSDVSISKATEMVLEKGRLPKGIAVSGCEQSRLLWMLSGQSCEDCSAFLTVPDKEYISCNMNFCVIDLEALLSDQEKAKPECSECLDKNQNIAADGMSASTSRDGTLLKQVVEEVPEPSAWEMSRKILTSDQESDDKSVLSYYSVASSMPKKTSDVIQSSSNEDFYSIIQTSSDGKESVIYSSIDRRVTAIERSILDLSRKQSTEMSEIRQGLSEIKQLILSISPSSDGETEHKQPYASSKILNQLESLQKDVHTVKIKVDSLNSSVHYRMDQQERRINSIKRDLESLHLHKS